MAHVKELWPCPYGNQQSYKCGSFNPWWCHYGPSLPAMMTLFIEVCPNQKIPTSKSSKKHRHWKKGVVVEIPLKRAIHEQCGFKGDDCWATRQYTCHAQRGVWNTSQFRNYYSSAIVVQKSKKKNPKPLHKGLWFHWCGDCFFMLILSSWGTDHTFMRIVRS